MSNLGKAIYMACFALMFVFAATTSIYLYGTLNTYLDSSTTLTTIGNRSESDSSVEEKERQITRSEIYITLYNMDEMHIDKLEVYETPTSTTPLTVTSEEAQKGSNTTDNGDLDEIIDYLDGSKTREFTYKYSAADKAAIYTKKSS